MRLVPQNIQKTRQVAELISVTEIPIGIGDFAVANELQA